MSKVKKENLTIPVYLDEQIVMDLIAPIDDGFSEFYTIETTKNKGIGTEVNANGQGKVLKLFKAKMDLSHSRENTNGTKKQESKVQTVVSMFHNLKQYLNQNGFIEKNNKEFKNGDFIELQGEFSINPLIDLLNTFSNFFEMSGVINKAANTSKAKNKRTEALKDMQIESQIKGLIKVFETDGKIDVICHSGDKTFIIPSKKEFFTDGKGDVIRTGNFRMLGKIVKICSEKENISLLRDTKIGKIKSSILDTAIESFNNPEIKNVVDFEPVVTNYDNAILVYPIAIYI
ncbi:hypothetical protein [Faecalibacillus intestinalis]|uniref:DUF6414 family protein n=1 Tax=Faecalibacillus intestinalis TaxID=1982626 RepID=UPI00295EC741|nr:hypothetical protein [Faecalibacillus intestinalis]